MSALRRRLRELLEAERAAGTFPDAAAWVSASGRPPEAVYVGAATPDTRWDLASLTKPRATVDLAMRAVADGRLSLDEPVAPWPLDDPPTARDLLAHRSGLPAWRDLAALVDARLGPWRRARWRPGEAAVVEVVSHALRDALAARPGATRPTIYSDLGYILLGWHLEGRWSAPLDALVPGYRRVGAAARPTVRVAPTGPCPFRGRALAGEVHDLNTWVLGGVAGHAGVFATVAEVGAWARGLADAAAGRPGPIDGGVVRAFWSPAERAPSGSWVLGWDTPSPGRSSAGARVSEAAVGHLGFTGTSVWIDRTRDAVCVLLTNRVAAAEDTQPAIKRFRPRLHDAVWETLDSL